MVLDVNQGDDLFRPAAERAKRRHARPHVLESDDDDDNDDEGREKDNRLEETVSDKVEAAVPVNEAPQILVNSFFKKVILRKKVAVWLVSMTLFTVFNGKLCICSMKGYTIWCISA